MHMKKHNVKNRVKKNEKYKLWQTLGEANEVYAGTPNSK